jgi:hypothetical protein
MILVFLLGRPVAYGDVWDRMSVSERRYACLIDPIVALGGSCLMMLLARWAS